jgi:hypothetical protein
LWISIEIEEEIVLFNQSFAEWSTDPAALVTFSAPEMRNVPKFAIFPVIGER